MQRARTKKNGTRGKRSAPAPRSLLRRCLPLVSFAGGIASALLMDRGPKRAALVAIAALVVWALVIAVHWLLRFELRAKKLGRLQRGLVGVARFSGLAITQSMIQLGLFFSAPFYFHAAMVGVEHVDPWHVAFLGGLALASAVTLWDPLAGWILRHPLLAPLLPAVSSFVALNCVLPGLGLSTEQALWLAASASALGVPLMVATVAPPQRRLVMVAVALGAGLAVLAGLRLGAARIVPAAPLRLVRAEIGDQIEGKWIGAPVSSFASAPARLICATAIASPVGLRDRLFHVWRKDGRELSRIELSFVGGRSEGYRTRSSIKPSGTPLAGRYDCSVVTATGQLLGTRSVNIAR